MRSYGFDRPNHPIEETYRRMGRSAPAPMRRALRAGCRRSARALRWRCAGRSLAAIDEVLVRGYLVAHEEVRTHMDRYAVSGFDLAAHLLDVSRARLANSGPRTYSGCSSRSATTRPGSSRGRPGSTRMPRTAPPRCSRRRFASIPSSERRPPTLSAYPRRRAGARRDACDWSMIPGSDSCK